MSKKRLILIVVIVLLVITFIALLARDKSEEEVVTDDENLEKFINSSFKYSFDYPSEWEVRERDNVHYFHPLLSRTDPPEIDINWGTYRQIYRTTFVGLSGFTHIDGLQEYHIEHGVYHNNNNFTLRQWYDIFILTEAVYTRRITQAEFIRTSRGIMSDHNRISSSLNLYDPWTPREEILTIGDHTVLKTRLAGDYRYDGYQYYIVLLNNNFLVFSFGYGGASASREVWGKASEGVKTIINTIESF